MRITSRRGTIVFFVCLGIGLVALAVALNVGWIILNWREGVRCFLGIIFFGADRRRDGLNTIFLVREIRRNEQHDSFINAVTHELKTPVASIRLYLQTLQRREVDRSAKPEFYALMLLDTDRLHRDCRTSAAGRAAGGTKESPPGPLAVDFDRWSGSASNWPALAITCRPLTSTTAIVVFILSPQNVSSNGGGTHVVGDPEDLRTAVSTCWIMRLNILPRRPRFRGARCSGR